MLIALEGGEAVVSQEMLRHDNLDETPSADTDAAAASVETEGPESEELRNDGRLTGWKLPVWSDVINKTSSVVQQTVQQTSSVVRPPLSFLSFTLVRILYVANLSISATK